MTLIGQDAATADFLSALSAATLHHAWLLTGPQGVGKGSFARMAALRMLAEGATPGALPPSLEVPATHPAAPLFAAGSHPDYKELVRLPRDGKEGAELVRSITIAQVRALQPLFATTPSLSPRRVVVIDAVDDLERAGANALLKNLEEPPAGTIFLLVSHAPGRLLPTIRSRCRLLRFSALDETAMGRVLDLQEPDLSPDERAALIVAGAGSPGRALRFAGLDLASIDTALETIAVQGDRSNSIRLQLGKALTGNAAQPRYEAFLERAPAFIAARAAERSGTALATGIAAWEAARALGGAAVGLSLDPAATVFEMAGHVARLAD